MGLELAKEAYIRGSDLTVIEGNVSVRIPSMFNSVKVNTTEEMAKAVFDLVPHHDIFIATAAVSDFKMSEFKDYKISSDNNLDIILEPTVKILANVKKINPKIFLVGFKAQYNASKEELVKSAYEQIENSDTDLVVANDVGAKFCNFGSDNNKVLIISDKVIETPLLSKREISKIIWDEIFKKIE